MTDIYAVFVLLASSSNKRQREDHIISTEGPLHRDQGSLMLPIYEREIFKVVESGFLKRKSYIIHGPYQSEKSSFLFELRMTLKCEKLVYAHSVPHESNRIELKQIRIRFDRITNRI